MLRHRHLALIAVGIMGAFAAVSCGGDDGGGGSGGTKDKEDVGAKAPPPPTGGAPAAGATPTVIAMRKLFLGDTDASGNPDINAWRKIGYNLDGLISTKNGTNHCKPQPGATKSSVQTDGVDGIDNSFGSNLMPIIGSLASDASAQISESLENGDFTIMLQLDKVEDAGSKPDQTGIAGALFGGAKFDAMVDCTATPTDPNCSPPKWDGSDKWPVLPELLNGGNISDPKLKFPTSYVASGTWVSGSEGTLDLSVSIQGFSLALNIKKAILTMKVAGSGATATATEGIIAGVIPADQLISELQKVAGGLDPSLCEGATFDSIAQQIKAASDIMEDGTNGDPTKTCNGISVGLGFEGQAVQLGGVAPTATAPENPCATPQ